MPKFAANKNDDIDLWLTRVNATAKGGKVSETEILKLLPQVLVQNIAKWYATTMANDTMANASWQDWQDELRNRIPNKKIDTKAIELQNRVWKPHDESFQIYSTD